jgi:hypothetical protein
MREQAAIRLGGTSIEIACLARKGQSGAHKIDKAKGA